MTCTFLLFLLETRSGGLTALESNCKTFYILRSSSTGQVCSLYYVSVAILVFLLLIRLEYILYHVASMHVWA